LVSAELAGYDEHPAGVGLPTEQSSYEEEPMMQDGEELVLRSNGQVWAVTWHPPGSPPEGAPHGAAGVCVTSEGLVVLISTDGEQWDLPGGRPEADEAWEQTLRREMLEETCSVVLHARLLGFSRGACREGHERGLVLVRSMWRAEVELGPWEPRFEIAHRRLVTAETLRSLEIGGPFAPLMRRALAEAGVVSSSVASKAWSPPAAGEPTPW
jgi:ADP-ribose pyrophosphatase YjhB (NUDIX family)